MNSSISITLYNKVDGDSRRAFCQVPGARPLNAPADSLLGDLLYLHIQLEGSKAVKSVLPQAEYIAKQFGIAEELAAETERINQQLQAEGFSCSEMTHLSYYLNTEFFPVLSKHNLPFNYRAFNCFQLQYGSTFPVPHYIAFYPKAGEYTYLEKLLLDDDKYALAFRYECKSFDDVMIALLHYLAINDYSLCFCQSCGRLFSPVSKSDEKYCRRSYNGKLCSKIAYLKKRRASYNTVDKKINSIRTYLTKRRFAVNISPEENSRRQNIVRKFLDEYPEKRDEMTEGDFLAWLDTWKVGGINNPNPAAADDEY